MVFETLAVERRLNYVAHEGVFALGELIRDGFGPLHLLVSVVVAFAALNQRFNIYQALLGHEHLVVSQQLRQVKFGCTLQSYCLQISGGELEVGVDFSRD